jgi:uncharacterized protein
MKYSFIVKGHPNVTSRHKTTLEFTKDPEISLKADCIVGVDSGVSMENIPTKLLDKMQHQDSRITVKLETENAHDEIHGFGHEDLTFDHPTDMVIRKSEFKCSRTLMILADKAACDLKPELIRDLADSKQLKVTIILE